MYCVSSGVTVNAGNKVFFSKSTVCNIHIRDMWCVQERAKHRFLNALHMAWKPDTSVCTKGRDLIRNVKAMQISPIFFHISIPK